VLLKFQGDVEAGTSKLSRADRDRVLKALAKHRDALVFWSFNLICVSAAAFVEPVQTALEVAPLAAFHLLRKCGIPTFLACVLSLVAPGVAHFACVVLVILRTLRALCS